MTQPRKQLQLVSIWATLSSVTCAVHDGKMTCCILQHSLYNRKCHPFCVCSCKAGEGVRKNHNDHQCKMTTQDQYKKRYNKSKTEFESKGHTEKTHRDWCDKSNLGITHFGMSPDKFNIESVYFDIFHLRSAMTRKLLQHFRNLIEPFEFDTCEPTFKCFDKLWESDCCSSHFTNNNTLSRIQGKQVKAWIKDMDAFLALITLSFDQDDKMKAFIAACKLLPKIAEFLNIVKIVENKDDCMKKLDE